MTICVVIAGVGTFFFVRSQNIMEYQLKEKLRSTAAVAALQFDGDELESIKDRSSMREPILEKTVEQLKRVRNNVPSIRFVYIMRPTKEEHVLEFLADADTFATPQELDRNQNGVVDEYEAASFPGDLYDASNVDVFVNGEAYLHPTVDQQLTKDQWGTAISGYAPIVNKKGRLVGILGIDMDAREYSLLTQSIFSPFAYLLLVLAGMFLTGYIVLYVWKRRVEVLEQVEHERSAFTRLAFHQLGAPLATFQWWVDILHDETKPPAGTQENEGWGQLAQGINRMRSILDALKMAHEVWEGNVSYTPEVIDLCQLVHDEAESLKPMLDPKFQTIEIVCPKKPAKTFGDKKLLQWAVHELLDNACWYSAEGKRTTVTITLQHGHLHLTVADQGIGIPQADLPNLFQKFMRGSNAAVVKPIGNGLGLYTIRGIMQHVGGRIDCESVEHKGTTFTLILPRRK